VEGGWRLRNLLAIPAGKFLPHGLDHLPFARDRLQGFGDILTHLAKPVPAAAITSRRRVDHDTLVGEMFGEGGSFATLAGKPGDRRDLGGSTFGSQFILGRTCRQFIELQRHLLDEQRRPLRPGAIDLPIQLGDPQFLMRDQGQIFRRFGARHRQFRGPHVTFGYHLPHLGALAHEHRFQRVDIVRQGCKIGVHVRARITNRSR